MQGKLELYQKEIDTAFKPIFARLEYYSQSMYEIRKLLMDYFFNATRTQKLTEAAQGEDVVFSFNRVKGAMEASLVDEGILLKTAQDMEDGAGHLGFVGAFDAHVASSGLPLGFQKENDLYVFKPEKSYTPNAQAFMRQFACALGIYRVCLGVYDNYFSIANYGGIQSERFENYIESANGIKQQLDGEVDLIDLHQQAKIIKKEINALLRTEKIHVGTNTFQSDIDILGAELLQILEFGATHLQSSYKEFPNNPILWMLHDRSWHTLLKTISGHLYANQYTYSTLYGTLEIKKEFIGVIKTEIDHFSTVALTKIPLLKIELLKKAAKLIGDTKIDILAKLAEQGIELIEAPQVGMFSTSVTPNLYQSMAAYYARQWVNVSAPVVDEEDEEDGLYPV